TKVGFAITVLDKVAELPAGLLIRDHEKVSGRFCGSVPLPCNCTVLPTFTVWFGPALAVGARIGLVVIITVEGSLLTRSVLVTINCATYVPGRSAVNTGFTAAGSLSVAALPAGTLSSVQWNVSISPHASVEPEPSNCTTELTFTSWAGPALATGFTHDVVE